VVDGLKLDCGASIGTAVFPEDGSSAEELMRNADLALYDAKAEGRGRCRQFTPALAEALDRKLALAKDLKQAIDQHEITAVFQPAVRSSDYEITGFEALARWVHPQLGPISPPEFVRIAEENGLASSLSELMIAAAIDAASSWPTHVHVSVNISPVQLNRDFVAIVRSILRAKNFDPTRLEIEVTEDALIRDFEQATLVFSRLREFGVQIAMDDFGAGFTTLGNLKRLNFDRVKLDRSIIQDVSVHRRAAAIVRSLFVLARELGINLTVEGIETVAEMDHLRAEGECDIQGYYFSKPQPKEYWDDFEARADEIRRKRQQDPVETRSNVVRHGEMARRRRASRP
jgi:predicted signal transduction protein with EAL and GGDEF domain